MRDSIRDKLSDAHKKAAEVRIGFIWTCGAVPFVEEGKVVSVEKSYVVISHSDGNEDTISLDNIFEVEEL